MDIQQWFEIIAKLLTFQVVIARQGVRGASLSSLNAVQGQPSQSCLCFGSSHSLNDGHQIHSVTLPDTFEWHSLDSAERL